MAKEIKYKKGIVTFLDLLGFGDLLATKTPAELAQVLAIFRQQGDPKLQLPNGKGKKKVVRDGEWNSIYQYAALSDCFFRCTETEHKINVKHPTGQLFHELSGLAFVQGLLLDQGYLVRGAVTFGEYHGISDAHGASLFGPAIARAYEIETKLANYPRIVIDPALIGEYWQTELLKNTIHTHEYEWTKYLSQYLRRDDSGVWFLDYLRVMLPSVGEPYPVLDFFNRHKEMVERQINELLKKTRPYPDSVTGKILWLLRYHNSTMNTLGDAKWNWLSDDAYTAEKEDFLVAVPDHPIFKEYELIKKEEQEVPPEPGDRRVGRL